MESTDKQMTQDEMWSVFAALDSVRSVRHEADLLLGIVRVSISCHGGWVVRSVDRTIDPAGAAALIADMDREAKRRNRVTAGRLRAIADQDRS